ncbi:MAG: hypothetical protein JNL93_02325 [Pelomonas sp.]|nr:hypothetical protein [Roseateles sp.]
MRKILLSMIVLFANSLCLAQGRTTVLADYRKSDRIILSDILLKDTPPRFEFKNRCPGENCNWVINAWIAELNTDPAERAFVANVSSKPPHIAEEILVNEFKRRYEKLASTTNGDFCLDSKNWGLHKDATGYYFGQAGRMPNVILLETNILHAGATDLIVAESGGKILQSVASQYITESVYTKISNLLKYTSEDKKAAIRTCGKIVGLFQRKVALGDMSVDPVTYVFRISRPIEIIRNGDAGTKLTLPTEWFN